MTTISDVRVTPLDLPIKDGKESLSAAYSKAGQRFTGILVAVSGDNGLTGYAEAPSRPYVYGDTVASLTDVATTLGCNLVGRDVREITEMRAEMDIPRGIAANLVAKGTLDVALHDLRARSLDMPLYEMLGGYHASTPSIRLTWLLPMHEPTRVLAEAEEAAADGYTSFKVKVGRRSSAIDVALIRDLRTTLGDETLIYADANSGYSIDVARTAVTKMADYGLAWIEDPCEVDLPRAARAALAAALPIPVLGDASCFTPRDAMRELQDATVGMCMVKLPRTGYLGAKAILDICQAAGVRCIIGTQGEMDVGTVAAGHLAASNPGYFEFTELSFFTRGVGSNLPVPLEVKGNSFELPAGAGLGVVPSIPIAE